jgi:hypothetical protein
MSKANQTATALAGILKAKRGDDPADSVAPPTPTVSLLEPPASPPPATTTRTRRTATAKPVEISIHEGRGGKSSDPDYSQYSVYLRKQTRKKVNRALDDADNGQDFSDLVQSLLEQWLVSRT